jgi:uncharacterized membrane protein YqhA
MGKYLEKSRYITIIGIASLLLASIAGFGWGAAKTISLIILVISSSGQDPDIAISLIKLVDNFLIATTLFIFAASMYELFIDKLTLPDWMLAENLHELKSKLSAVIILVMAVKFLEHFMEWKDPLDTLLFGIGVAVVSVALIALSNFGGKD